MGDLVFWSWTMQFHYCQKNTFFIVSWHKTIFWLKVGIKTVFLSLGLGYHQIPIIEFELLQCRGTQIRVNTWTGSYTNRNISSYFELSTLCLSSQKLIWPFKESCFTIHILGGIERNREKLKNKRDYLKVPQEIMFQKTLSWN